jgi:peptidoglycan/LPS O-acetylase OafA/YrhL
MADHHPTEPIRPVVATVADEPREQRIVALDGLRGMMTIIVVVSHYFGEVEHGISALMAGWVAVNVFFVLSGYLVGRLLLDKMHCDNFLTVFYVRRAFRTLPVYIVCVALVYLAIYLLEGKPWLDADVVFPFWSYITFTQNFFMVSQGSIGAHWLAPTWTLSVEEYFYLVGPALFFAVRRQWLLSVLLAIAALSVVARAGVFWGGLASTISALVMLPFLAFVIIAGLVAAILMRDKTIDWTRYDLALRIIPIVMLVAAGLLQALDGSGKSFGVFGGLLVSIGSASLIMSIVRGAPEAKRYESKVLCFFGTTSYSVYLTHLMVLGLMHGAFLGTKPDIATPAQLLVTCAALPVAVLVGWVLTRLVEAPLTAYGRTWKWSKTTRVGWTPNVITAMPVGLAKGTA